MSLKHISFVTQVFHVYSVLEMQAKDLNLAAASAEEVGHKSPLISKAQEIYKKMCEEGHETKDFSCVFRHFYNGKDEV